METNNKSIENFNELIFENRHKEYGAYAIRKSYTDTVTIALFITSLFFGIVALSASWLNNREKLTKINIDVPIIDTVMVVPFNFTQPPEIIVESIKPIEIKKQKSDNINYKAADDKQDEVIKPTETAVITKGDGKGVDSSATPLVAPSLTFGAPAEDLTKVIKYPDQLPEFLGINKFILDNLKYPQNAVREGMQGTVYVSFVVEIDGSISNVELLKGIGDGCAEEAIRVVKMFPKWKPGIYKGKARRSQCNLPIKFRLQN